MSDKRTDTTEIIERRDERVAWRIIRRFARGNVRMQQAAMLSKERLDEQAEARARRIARLRETYGV